MVRFRRLIILLVVVVVGCAAPPDQRVPPATNYPKHKTEEACTTDNFVITDLEFTHDDLRLYEEGIVVIEEVISDDPSIGVVAHFPDSDLVYDVERGRKHHIGAGILIPSRQDVTVRVSLIAVPHTITQEVINMLTYAIDFIVAKIPVKSKLGEIVVDYLLTTHVTGEVSDWLKEGRYLGSIELSAQTWYQQRKASNDVLTAYVGQCTTNDPPKDSSLSASNPASWQGTLYVSMNTEGNYQIFEYPFATQTLTQITSQGSNYTPAMAPDGSRIAFTSERDGREQVYVMNRDGSQQQRISQDAGRSQYPSWSRDGRSLVYTHHDNLHSQDDSTGWRILIQDIDSLRANMLSDEWGTWPQWSANGIIFTTRSNGQLDIASAPIGSRSSFLIQAIPTIDEHFSAISPDGRSIAFVAGNSRNLDKRQIWVMDIDGRNARQITSGRGRVSTPTWSPDGRFIAFLAQWSSQTYEPWIVPREGGKAERVLVPSDKVFGLAWGN